MSTEPDSVTPEPIPLDFVIHDPDDVRMVTMGKSDGPLHRQWSITVPAELEDWVGNSFDLILQGKFREALMTTAGPVAEDLARAAGLDDKAVQEAYSAANGIASKLTIRQITGIIDHVTALAGVTPGESDSSATSSRSTGTKSKQISSRSTE